MRVVVTSIIAAAASLAAAVGDLHATTITFGQQVGSFPNSTFLTQTGDTYTEAGYRFTENKNAGSYGYSVIGSTSQSNVNSNGTYVLSLLNPGNAVTLTAVDGLAFSLQQFDAASFFNGTPLTLRLTGRQQDGASVTADVVQTGAAASAFLTYLLPSFVNLLDVRIVVGGSDTGSSAAVDNLVVNATAVPEPGAAVLFTAGLAGMLLLQRRRSTD